MCRRDDFPPYTVCRSCDMRSDLCICEMPAPGYDAQTRPIPADPPLYIGPRCDSCGGDHLAALHEAPDDTEELEAASDTIDRTAHEALDRQGVFLDLDPDKAADFRSWAGTNYTPGERISPMWHPVIRAECERMNDEAAWEERTERTNR